MPLSRRVFIQNGLGLISLSIAMPFVLFEESPAIAQQLVNLVPDASFEGSLPSWFSTTFIPGKDSYFAAKDKIADAPDGDQVLDIRGWENAGSKILSPVFPLTTDTYSATFKLRSFATAAGANLELALFDEKGAVLLASFIKTSLDGKGQWATLSGTQKIAIPATQGRLAILVSGPQKGARVEMDQLGLFAGSIPGAVTDNGEFIFWEAESMANGTSWKEQDDYRGWYSGYASGMKMLNGSGGVDAANNQPATKTVNIRHAGAFRLWTRLMRVAAANSGTYTIAVKQNGKVLSSLDINDGDAKLGADFSWVWVPLDVNLATGSSEIELQRPPNETSWVARKIDLFALTNSLEYQPQMADFLPKDYMRFTNLSTGQEPFCLWMFVHRLEGPVYYMNPGILSDAGLSGSYYVPGDKTKWLAPGESSPWVEVGSYLEQANLIQLIATRGTHVAGYVTGNVRGTLEFAAGEDKKIVKTVDVNQDAPRILMTLPADFQTQSDQILTGFDYEKKSAATLDDAKIPDTKPAKYLDLSAILSLGVIDDPKLLDAEVANLRRMGFNGSYTPVTDPKDAAAFNQAHGWEQHFGMLAGGLDVKNGCYNQPDTEKMEAGFKSLAESYAPIITKTERIKFADEPSGQPYEHYATCDFCKNLFREQLKASGFTPQQLGVATWDAVVPVMPENADKQPELFYRTGLFRLQSFANLLKAAVAAKNKYIPNNVKSYVNYSPPTSEQLTWTQRGNDLFMTQRDGALEMGWTEDWLGYGASPQQMSPLYAQLRAAGAPTNEPLGGYMVGVSGGPLLQRIKYYEMVAAGGKHINVYDYGPYYASVDSWSTTYDIYPTISAVQHELAKIDEALNGTSRRKTDVAILYNRSAGIWMKNTSDSEQDARYIHWALAHAGYDADFIPEEDVVAGKLANYKVLYLTGVQIRGDAAQKIADWTKNGGVLFGDAGAGSHDENNRPLDTLDTVFGIQSQDLKLVNPAGRPKYELRTLPVLDELSTTSVFGAQSVTFNQLCYSEKLNPAADAKVLLTGKNNSTMGVLHSFGKGTAIRIAALPGITYLNDAIRSKDYDIETYLPQDYNPTLRDFIAWPAMLAKAFRTAYTNAPIAEIVRYDGAKCAVIFVIDHNAKPRPDFVMKVPDAAQFRKARTATGKPVQITKLPNEMLQVAWPLDVADAVVLE